jgi:hypothetical protein
LFRLGDSLVPFQGSAVHDEARTRRAGRDGSSWAEAHEGDPAKQVRLVKLEGSRLTMRTPLQLGTRTVTAGTGSARSQTELVLEREK